MNEIYKEQTISPELAIVIGAITETQKMIDDTLKNIADDFAIEYKVAEEYIEKYW